MKILSDEEIKDNLRIGYCSSCSINNRCAYYAQNLMCNSCIFTVGKQVTLVKPYIEQEKKAQAELTAREKTDEFIDELNKLVVLHSEIKPNGHVVIKAGAIHDLTVKLVKERQAFKASYLEEK